MAHARITIDPSFTVAPLDRRVFGSFVEHLGRCVYDGIHEPDHPSADPAGFRTDVADLVRELGPTVLRYPGGNFVSGYAWEDGVGPRQDRPVRHDLAWNVRETNQVGTDEFLQWAERVGIEAMMAVNLGTRGITEAIELLQYCTAPVGLELSDRRASHGRTEPYAVDLWCLGNEMDGPWQIGHKSPEEYARLAAETARAMKAYRPDLELVACGSSSRGMPTFGRWERIVLEECFDLVEHISAHAYYEPIDGDADSFLASAEDMDRFISAVVATADHVAALKRSSKRITISFDEWNVWFQSRYAGEKDAQERSLVEVYDVSDAVVVGSLLIELIRHADRVAVACLAQLVNVIAPIRTEVGGPAWRQTIFHPFALSARHARGEVLQVVAESPTVDTARYGPVGALHSTAIWDDEAGELTVLAVNRSRQEALELAVDLDRFGVELELIEHVELHDRDPHARNSAADPDRVVPHAGGAALLDGVVSAELPPISWHLLRFG